MTKTSKPILPRWAQWTIGVFILVLILIFSTQHTFYVSDWHRPDSNFYNNTMDALRQSEINIFKGSTPTLVVFWEQGCKDCNPSLRALKGLPKNVNIVGVHLKIESQQKIKARQWWFSNTRKGAPLYFDKEGLLENTFLVRNTPAHFLFFPKKKALYSYSGNLNWVRPTIQSLMPQQK